MSPGVKKYQICFSKRYQKLDPLRLRFTTVRWLDSFYMLGKVYEIFYVVPNLYHRKIHMGSARLVKLEIQRIERLLSEFCQLDADCSCDAFYQLMRGWYKQKPGWKGVNSEIQILYLERVFQVNEKNVQNEIEKTIYKQQPLRVEC